MKYSLACAWGYGRVYFLETGNVYVTETFASDQREHLNKTTMLDCL